MSDCPLKSAHIFLVVKRVTHVEKKTMSAICFSPLVRQLSGAFLGSQVFSIYFNNCINSLGKISPDLPVLPKICTNFAKFVRKIRQICQFRHCLHFWTYYSSRMLIVMYAKLQATVTLVKTSSKYIVHNLRHKPCVGVVAGAMVSMLTQG